MEISLELFSFALIFIIFGARRLSNLPIRSWFIIFCVVSVLDMASTYVAVYVYDAGWTAEMNPIIQFLGGYIPFSLALPLHSIFAGVFLVAFYKLITPRIGKPSGYSFIVLLWCSVVRTTAAFFNFSLPLFME